MKSKVMKKESNLARLVKSPVRFLIKARDAYIRGMTSVSVGFIRGGGGSSTFGLPAGSFQVCEPQSTILPRSFTLNSSTTTTATRDRFRFGGSGEIKATMGRKAELRRNHTCVVMGRIDEDQACDEFEDKALLFDQLKKRKFGQVFTIRKQ